LPEGADTRRELTRAPPSALYVTLPNLITVARLCAVPATVWLILHGRMDLGFGLFIGAGISDAVDGWLARIRNARSKLGAILDPLADKALLVSVYVTLAAVGVLPDWLAILVVFRDMLIIGGFLMLWVLEAPPRVRPLLVSKLNTALQIGLAALALGLAGFNLAAPLLLEAGIWATAACTLVSGGAYVWLALRRVPA
jgi:cardiolipin synthase